MTSAPRTAQASQEVRVPVEQERVPRGRAASAPGRRQHPLADAFDVLLLDLDGVVYVGSRAVPGAADHLAHARRRGMRLSYVTNNASRPPEAIAAQLRAVGVPADPAEIVTSAQAAAREVATLVPAGSPVLVLGGAGLHQAVVAAGLRPVEDDASGPLAVVQGFSPDLTWRQLAQGTYAVRRGVPWVVSNLDRTLPTEEGLAPGNGTLVELVRSAADVPLPISVGKPARTLFDEAVRRTGARSALVVGDRLDTDIEGANAAGLPSLLVLTGVTGPAELAAAPPQLRPTYIGADMGALFRPYDKVAVHDGQVQCGGWTATVAGTGSGGRAELAGSGEWVDGLRCVVTLGWCTAGTPPIDVAAALARLGEQDRDHREDGAGAR